MPQPSIYFTDDDRHSYTPISFIAAYNEYGCVHAASAGMGIAPKRLSVIASRLRSRGHWLRRFDENRRS